MTHRLIRRTIRSSLIGLGVLAIGTAIGLAPTLVKTVQAEEGTVPGPATTPTTGGGNESGSGTRGSGCSNSRVNA